MKRIGLALCAALALLAAGCSKQPEAKPDDIRPVRVLAIDAVVAARSIEFAGEVRPRYETRLAFRVGGKMTQRLVEVGSIVKAGQPVARLDPRDLQLAEASAKSQIIQLEAEMKFAEGDLKRYRDLRAKNFISEAEFGMKRLVGRKSRETAEQVGVSRLGLSLDRLAAPLQPGSKTAN